MSTAPLAVHDTLSAPGVRPTLEINAVSNAFRGEIASASTCTSPENPNNILTDFACMQFFETFSEVYGIRDIYRHAMANTTGFMNNGHVLLTLAGHSSALGIFLPESYTQDFVAPNEFLELLTNPGITRHFEQRKEGKPRRIHIQSTYPRRVLSFNTFGYKLQDESVGALLERVGL
jgi:hypothetical protein